MEKDIDRISKNADTDIVIRIDDFGGKKGVTIREYVKGERYTGFTKAGTRIPADKFKLFKKAINSIDEKELEETNQEKQETSEKPKENKTSHHSMRDAHLDEETNEEEKEIEDEEF